MNAQAAVADANSVSAIHAAAGDPWMTATGRSAVAITQVQTAIPCNPRSLRPSASRSANSCPMRRGYAVGVCRATATPFHAMRRAARPLSGEPWSRNSGYPRGFNPAMPRDRTLSIVGSACLALAAGLAGAVVLDAGPAAAMQEYAKKEGKECSFCHLNPKGAGPRNAKGREYEANGHVFGAKSWTSEANEKLFLRASSAVLAQWYAEADRVLTELDASEPLAGGKALVAGTRDRFKMFPRAWAGAAKKLLAQEERGLPKRLEFLAKLESQFPATDEGKDAVKALDELAKDAARAKAVENARASEKVRVMLLQGRTEWDLGNADTARALFEKVVADPRGSAFATEIEDLLRGRAAR